jgi:hypothetical protein
MGATDLPDPDRTPPRGVPRWLWPPPGSHVRRVVLREEWGSGISRQHVVEGERPEPTHLRALQWLIGEHPRDDAPEGGHGVSDVLLEIARTEMRAGRVGHSYALNGQALGAPSNRGARGVLWRYALSVLGRAPMEFDHWDDLFA